MVIRPISYTKLPPAVDEDVATYARRLEALGSDETYLRKAVTYYYGRNCLPADFFEEFERARFAYIELIIRITPLKPRRGIVLKLARRLSITEAEAEAEAWMARFEARPSSG